MPAASGAAQQPPVGAALADAASVGAAPADAAPAVAAPDVGAAAGRVTHDARGNAVWNWGQDVLESTTRMLKRLVVPGMALEEDPREQAAKAEKAAQDAPGELQVTPDRQQGYDPYGSAGTEGKPRR